MTTLTDLEKQLKSLLAASAKFYPGKKAQVNDYYEAYLWAEMVSVARANLWTVSYVNAGSSHDEFNFRMGPGKLTSTTKYTFATLADSRGRKGELHVGVRVQGNSGVLHEFDVVAFNEYEVAIARLKGLQPDHGATRLHVEAKFHTSDLSLGVAAALLVYRPTVQQCTASLFRAVRVPLPFDNCLSITERPMCITRFRAALAYGFFGHVSRRL